MATSRSSSGDEWTAGALLFSGRPDPTWSVADDTAERLLAVWEALGPWTGPLPEAPPLGYRGSFLRNEEGRTWRAFGGAVTFANGACSESRRDGRSFERALLETAPPDLVPERLLGGFA